MERDKTPLSIVTHLVWKVLIQDMTETKTRRTILTPDVQIPRVCTNSMEVQLFVQL